MCLDTSMHNLSPYDFLCGDRVGDRNLLKKRFVDACVLSQNLGHSERICKYAIWNQATIRCQQYVFHATSFLMRGCMRVYYCVESLTLLDVS